MKSCRIQTIVQSRNIPSMQIRCISGYLNKAARRTHVEFISRFVIKQRARYAKSRTILLGKDLFKFWVILLKKDQDGSVITKGTQTKGVCHRGQTSTTLPDFFPLPCSSQLKSIFLLLNPLSSALLPYLPF